MFQVWISFQFPPSVPPLFPSSLTLTPFFLPFIVPAFRSFYSFLLELCVGAEDTQAFQKTGNVLDPLEQSTHFLLWSCIFCVYWVTSGLSPLHSSPFCFFVYGILSFCQPVTFFSFYSWLWNLNYVVFSFTFTFNLFFIFLPLIIKLTQTVVVWKKSHNSGIFEVRLACGHTCMDLFWLLINTGRPSSWWVAPSLGRCFWAVC